MSALPEEQSDLRAQIADYYVSDHIVSAFSRLGGIPHESTEEILGIGFIDIVNYSRFTDQLSANDNQHILNGLYTALNLVLRQHGGCLNKIEGDSIMFHFGGRADPLVEGMNDEEQLRDVSRRLFFACVQMQRFARFFNSADVHFFSEALATSPAKPTEADMAMLRKAIDGITAIKSTWVHLERDLDVEQLIRVRIGATVSIGTASGGLSDPFVCDIARELLPDETRSEAEERAAIFKFIRDHSAASGNFGPEGAKQWDILGPPVIEAKRLESTAPAGGLRISALLHKVLEVSKVARNYWRRFQHEAKSFGSEYRFATLDDLFRKGTVVLEDKGNVTFDTYSVQVNPRLPEEVSDQIGRFLVMGSRGADEIVNLLQYYRGIEHVVNAFERALDENGIRLRKRYMIETMFPSQSEHLRERFGDDDEKTEEYIESKYSLYAILEKLDRFRDLVKVRKARRRGSQISPPTVEGAGPSAITHEQHMADYRAEVVQRYDDDRAQMVQRAYFFNVVDPLVFESVRASIIECQTAARAEESELEELEELEIIDEGEELRELEPLHVRPSPSDEAPTTDSAIAPHPGESAVPVEVEELEEIEEIEALGDLEELDQL